ncbi:MAG: peptide chain release factor N(5)-glutamine methyltransferase [Chloroflexi bacterium]|nr:peptide chain release factor N(5)-glutamine methyltransferase [Chloroflexota bacterium]
MTVGHALRWATETLASVRIEDASLEAEVLLRHVLGLDRVQLYLAFDDDLGTKDSEAFRWFIERRLSGEPAAYLTGHREFFGLDFYVDRNVLIPRPETELLVEQMLAFARESQGISISDVGTGSGAVAVSVAVHVPKCKIYAIDVSPAALKVARKNCEKHGVLDRVTLLQGDLLDPLPEPVDLIVANLPYVREEELSKVNTQPFEPSLALNGGADGLDVIRRLVAQAEGKLRPGGVLLLEVGAGQSEAVAELLRQVYHSTEIDLIPDLRGIKRVVRVGVS